MVEVVEKEEEVVVEKEVEVVELHWFDQARQ